MKDYKVENPQFTDTLQITETTDTSHADNINRAPKQAFENTLYLEKSKVAVDGGDVSDTVIKTEGDAGEEDYPVPEAGDTSKTFLGKTKKFISNFKDWMTGVCMLGAIVNNCVTDNPNLPLSAAQGKALQDALTVLNNEAKSLSSNLDSSKIKSKSFTTTVDQYSQVAVTVSGTIIAAIAPRYLVIVQDDNHTLRLFGSIAQYQLNRVDQGTTVNVMVFYF